MTTVFKILSLVFAALFLWAAYVQYNDPDALQWYFIYGVATLASILFYINKLNYLIALCLGGIYFVLAITTWPDSFEGVTIGQGDIVNIEKGREALGLLIVSAVMFAYAIRTKMTRILNV